MKKCTGMNLYNAPGTAEEKAMGTAHNQTARVLVQTPGSEKARAVRRVTWAGLVLNLALAGLKFAFGVLASSQALVADAVHSLSDMATDVAVLVGAGLWTAPADEAHPYGHGRIETVVTVAIGVVLAGVGLGLAYRAVATVLSPAATAPGWAAFAAACAAVIAKEAIYRWTVRVGREVRSSALMANAWHHRSDALSSVPVAVAVLGTQIHPDWLFLDNIGALLVSLLVLHVAWRIAWPSLKELVDTGADDAARAEVARLALETPGVKSVHGLRTRHIGPALQVDLHVLVEGALSVREGHNIAGAVKKRLLDNGPDVADVLVHIEPYEDHAPAPETADSSG